MVQHRFEDPDRVHLTLDQGSRIAERLMSLVDRNSEIGEALVADGFSSFLLLQDWYESYCKDETEVEKHRRCRIEELKEWLARAIHGPQEGNYISSYLEKLRRERDAANGMPEEDLFARFGPPESYIRSLYDLCELNHALAHQADSEAYEKRSEAAKHAQRQQFKREAVLHRSGVGDDWGKNESARLKYFVVLAEHYGLALGFAYEKSKSTRARPALSKSLSDEWDFRFTVTDTSFFGDFVPLIGKASVEQSDTFHPRALPELLMCPKGLKGNLRDVGRPDEVARFLHQQLVYGFDRSYYRFSNNDESELLIKAHMNLLSQVLPEIEAAVANVI